MLLAREYIYLVKGTFHVQPNSSRLPINLDNLTVQSLHHRIPHTNKSAVIDGNVLLRLMVHA